MRKILENKIRCRKCGDILVSTHAHDFRECSCKAVAVDGGPYCLRRLGEPEDWEDLSVLEPEEEANS